MDLEAAEFFIGSRLDSAKILETFKGRIQDIGRGRWWINGFIQFQCGELSETCIPHKKIVLKLREHGLYEEYKTTLECRVESTLKEEDKEEDKEWEGECRGEGVAPTPPFLPPPVEDFFDLMPETLRFEGFKSAWAEWLAERKAKKNPVTRRSAKGQFSMLEKLGPEKAIMSISESICNGYTGLFAPRGVKAQPAAIPAWKRLEAVDERIKALNSEFSVAKEEGARQAIRDEISTLRAERKALGGV